MPKALPQLLCPVPDAVGDALQQDPIRVPWAKPAAARTAIARERARRLARDREATGAAGTADGPSLLLGGRHKRGRMIHEAGRLCCGVLNGNPLWSPSVSVEPSPLPYLERLLPFRMLKPLRGQRPWPVQARAYTDLHNVTTIRSLGGRGLPVNEMGCSSHRDPGRFRQH
jgi:hypothetical protein